MRSIRLAHPQRLRDAEQDGVEERAAVCDSFVVVVQLVAHPFEKGPRVTESVDHFVMSGVLFAHVLHHTAPADPLDDQRAADCEDAFGVLVAALDSPFLLLRVFDAILRWRARRSHQWEVVLEQRHVRTRAHT